jgi:hypothetical protein
MLDYIPSDLSALDREHKLMGWLKNVTSGMDFNFLNPEGGLEKATTKEISSGRHLQLLPR